MKVHTSNSPAVDPTKTNGGGNNSASPDQIESTKNKIEVLKSEVAGKSDSVFHKPNIGIPPKVFAGLAEVFTKVLININKCVDKFLDRKLDYLEKHNDNGSNDAEILEVRTKKAQISALTSFLESQKDFWHNESKTDYPPGTEEERESLYGSIADLQRAYRHAVSRGDNDQAAQIYSQIQQAQKQLDELGNKTSNNKNPINAKANQETVYADAKGKMQTSQQGKDFWAKEKEFWNSIAQEGYPQDVESFDIASADLIELEDQADKLLQIGTPEAMSQYNAVQAEIVKKQNQLTEICKDDVGSSDKTAADEEESYSDYKGDFYTNNISELQAMLSDSNTSQEDKATIQAKINTLKQAEGFWHGEEDFWYQVDKKGEPSDPDKYDSTIADIIKIESQIDLLYQQGNPDQNKIGELTSKLIKSKTDLMSLFSA